MFHGFYTVLKLIKSKLGWHMNINLGLFRLWVVASSLWVLVFYVEGRFQGLIATKLVPVTKEEKKSLTLNDFKELYPQYKKYSNEKLAEALHEKYYKDMSMDEFKKKIEFYNASKICSDRGLELPCSHLVIDPDMAFNDIDPRPSNSPRFSGTPVPPWDIQEQINIEPDWTVRIKGLEYLVFPPLGAFICGMSILWIIAGFRRPKEIRAEKR